jgi:DNA-binding transcriptional regulator YiaG
MGYSKYLCHGFRIKASTDLTQMALAEKYNISVQTARKWQQR